MICFCFKYSLLAPAWCLAAQFGALLFRSLKEQSNLLNVSLKANNKVNNNAVILIVIELKLSIFLITFTICALYQLDEFSKRNIQIAKLI